MNALMSAAPVGSLAKAVRAVPQQRLARRGGCLTQ
jgi:hypothetical protein